MSGWFAGSVSSMNMTSDDLSRPLSLTWRQRLTRPEVLVALGAFLALCIAVLTRSMSMLEPDDYAYRASIIALTHGHIILTNTQYLALRHQLGHTAQPGIMQWIHLTSGKWISEKNPGYPFFAAPFQMLGILRLAPLFYGGLGCIGLYAGARRWLGRWGGTWAVVLFCCSGAAIAFAWRATMPTFTDASLIAAGTGALLWTMLATEASARRRTVVGLLGFLALEGATFIRYTNGLVLIVAVIAVLVAWRLARLSWRMIACWLASLAAFVALVAAFGALFYGGVTNTGYAAGEITFSLSAVIPNLKHMPSHLVSSMPFLVLAAIAAIWIAARLVLSLRKSLEHSLRSTYRRDAVVGAALFASWIAIYGIYLAYTWTVPQASGVGGVGGGGTIHVVRFYVPALAAIALLAAWLLSRLPRWLPLAALAVLVGLGGVSYPRLVNGAAGGPGGPGGAGGFGGPGGQGQLVGPPANGQQPSGQQPNGSPPSGNQPNGLPGQ